ncbi:glycoside hydrolase family 13 protein [Streptomyces sp. SID13031]|uniref:glycoside hydrolase family 13 protein n=1 Tax=Streptomyces sp. SID13031 TaxID=2706046 RepID=UPI0013C88744|nr:glycoside hydrolase family 13 protein [Streptomyces sp. SID13031]NEA36895.1 glycoside hydrolase family 13 protein [Streptomyces sp. SID13031]
MSTETTTTRIPWRTARNQQDWWRSAVIYQVYVRSFQDSDGDGIGDLTGVRARLPYLRSLGVDGIWLNPFYPSPQHDHGYDVSDYFSVHPDYGTLESFDRLVHDAHRLDLKVLIDIVPNHCSIEHPWFAAALAAGPGSLERERFHFADGRGENGELPPNNWRSIFGGSAWQRVTEPDGSPGQWYLHSFAPEQADFNWLHPDVTAHFEQVLRFWLDRGVDGIRIDVAHGLHKADGLPDHENAMDDELTGDPLNPLAWNQPAVHKVWRRWRTIAEGYTMLTGRERVLIGEVGVLDTEQLALYQRPDELHQSFYFEFLRAHWDRQTLYDVVNRGLGTIAASGSSVAWVLNNHDMPRSVTRYGGGAPGVDTGDVDLGTLRARAAALLMLALPGAAYVYQGEELGLPEVTDLPVDVLADPMFHRSQGVRRGRDGCRVPLPWAASQDGFGFSSGDPWLPQPDWFADHAVDRQLSSGESMLHLYRETLALRQQRLPALAGDEFRWLRTDPGVLAFTRGDGFACVVNCSSRVVPAPVNGELLLASHEEAGERLPPNSAAWYLLPESTEAVGEAA